MTGKVAKRKSEKEAARSRPMPKLSANSSREDIMRIAMNSPGNRSKIEAQREALAPQREALQKEISAGVEHEQRMDTAEDERRALQRQYEAEMGLGIDPVTGVRNNPWKAGINPAVQPAQIPQPSSPPLVAPPMIGAGNTLANTMAGIQDRALAAGRGGPIGRELALQAQAARAQQGMPMQAAARMPAFQPQAVTGEQISGQRQVGVVPMRRYSRGGFRGVTMGQSVPGVKKV